MTFVAADAAEFRRRVPINTPQRLPAGAVRVEKPVPVARAVVEQSVRRIFDSYTAGPAALGAMMAESFVDRDRLLDTMTARLPRNARLTVLGVQSVRTIDQHLQPDEATGGMARVSTVSAVVRGQLEFDDPVAGHQRLEGTSELLIRVTQRGAP